MTYPITRYINHAISGCTTQQGGSLFLGYFQGEGRLSPGDIINELSPNIDIAPPIPPGAWRVNFSAACPMSATECPSSAGWNLVDTRCHFVET